MQTLHDGMLVLDAGWTDRRGPRADIVAKDSNAKREPAWTLLARPT
jgi:hypothetical protein